MKWYQAHLRVMFRLFELGFFDEVNSIYRKYCIEGTDSDFYSFNTLVLEDNDIKLYCDELSPQNIDKKDLNSSDIVAYYYKAIACFTMVKALPKLSDSKLNEVDVSGDMPVRPYNVLFEKNGDIKDDVLIKAFEKQDFTSSPKVFVSKFLRLGCNWYQKSNQLTLPFLIELSAYNKNRIITSKAAQDTLLSTNRGLKSSQKLQESADKTASTVKEVNYFNIDSSLDSGLQVLKVIDLLGLHLLLVAQRRKFLFERCMCDDLRSNYKALEQVNSDDIVRLHNNALAACLAFEETLKGLHSNASDSIDCNKLVKDYVGRNDALYQYLCYFVQLFESLEAHEQCTNKANSWKVEYYYFNLNGPFKQLSYLHSKLLIVVDDLLNTEHNLIKCLNNHLSNEQEIVNNLLGSIPPSVFDICAHFALSFNNVKLSHPSLVDFKDIVSSIMSYHKNLNHSAPTLPYPIKKGCKYDVEDCGEIIWLKRRYRDSDYMMEATNVHLAYEVINDPRPIVFSRKLNVYFDMFCVISELVEFYNNYYLRTICSNNDELKPGTKLSFAFDLSYCSEDLVKTLYPTYELLLKDETFIKLIECHQACFEHLVLIMDLQGDINLLYEDNYMSDLLRKTNNYDQELADSLALNKMAIESSDTPNLSKAEQLLLNKTCISYLQDCQKICHISKELIEKTMELDKFLSEKLEKFTFAKIQTFSQIQNLCLNHIIAFSQYIISNLDNVPEGLKLRVAVASNNDRLNNEVGIKQNQSFYQCVYETFLVFLAKNMNLFIKDIIPYTKLATKEDFAKSLNSLCLFNSQHLGFINSHYLVLVAYKRLLQSCNYDTLIIKHIYYNPLFVNSALIWIIREYSYSLKLTIVPLVKRFVRIVLSFTRIKEVDEYQPYLNMIYNLVQKLTKLFSTNQAKIRSLNALVEQGNVVLCESFEYKSYIFEIVDGFSLFESLWRKYNRTYDDLTYIYDACQISGFRALYQDLLEDAPRVLKCIDVNYYKNLGTDLHNGMPYFKEQDYVSINREYISLAMKSGGERLSQPLLLAVEQFFGQAISAIIQEEDDNFYGSEKVDSYPFLWLRRHPREKGLTKNHMRVINLVMGKMRLLDDDELHQVLNMESQKMATQIVDSSTDTATSKPKAKASTAKSKAVAAKSKTATTKSKATAAAKSKAHKAATKDAADADVIIEPLDAIEAEPKAKAKSTRSKAKKAEEVSEANLKAKSNTKATATKSSAKKLAATSSNEATVTADAAKVTEAMPNRKATRANKVSTATATATAKATAVKDASAQAIAEEKLEAEAKTKTKAKSTRSKAKSTTKATATKSRAKKVAAVDATEAAAEVTDAAKVAEAAPKKKAARARTTSKESASTSTKKSTAKS